MFFLIDKPSSITSFDILRNLRKKLNIRKMWHTWTLDPLATGLVLVAVWSSTKLIKYLEKKSKIYRFKIGLDWKTDSFDIDTEVNYITSDKKKYFKEKLTKDFINEILQKNFLWKIKQIPPKYSALKIWWKKALNLVRLWKDFKLKEREVSIDYIDIISFSYPDIIIEAKVSSGTYIRSIANDLWNILETWWYIKELRRIKLWNLDMRYAQKLDNFDKDKELDLNVLFSKDRFIKLDKDVLLKLDNWLFVRWDFWLKDGKDLFVKKWNKITNIVKYENSVLKPVRKI